MVRLTYRLARIKDKEVVNQMLQQAIQFLAEQGIDQWQNNSVTIAEIMPAIERQTAYCWVDSSGMIQAFAVLESHDIFYDDLAEGEWQFDGPYYAIHRVMMAEQSRGKGYTRRVFNDIEEIGHQHGKQSLRIDTHHDNVIMQKTINKMGFTQNGVTRVADGTARLTFEKKL